MKRLIAVLSVLAATSTVQAQTVDLFRSDPMSYFRSKAASKWVGAGVYFQVNYTDTLHFSPDSTGAGLMVRRVLVNADKGTAVSRGIGIVLPQSGDSVFTVRWSEKSYPQVNGAMRWQEGQWIVSFDGEWKEWTIRIRQDQPGSLVAAAARLIPGFGPVELTAMTYKAITR